MPFNQAWLVTTNLATSAMDARRLGPAPESLELPAGRYRFVATSEKLAAALGGRFRSAPVDLMLNAGATETVRPVMANRV